MIPKSEKFNYLPGKWLEGIVEGMEIKVVGPNYLKDKSINVIQVKDESARTIVYIVIDNVIAGFFSFSNQIREESFEAIQLLKEAEIKNLLLTPIMKMCLKK
ncbi:MAG: hypothetical protein ABI675_26020 [Chitinophagaceae bacterium]